MKLRELAILGAASAVMLPALATLPSIKFGDLARASDCIVLAMPAQGHRNQQADVIEFEALAAMSGTTCVSGAFTVARGTSESPGAFADSPYLLFLHRHEGKRFGYAAEPFGALSVRDGMVSTNAFMELPRSMPFEAVSRLIKEERERLPADQR